MYQKENFTEISFSPDFGRAYDYHYSNSYKTQKNVLKYSFPLDYKYVEVYHKPWNSSDVIPMPNVA